MMTTPYQDKYIYKMSTWADWILKFNDFEYYM